MHFHYLQHVEFEDPGSMLPTLQERGHRLSATRMFDGDVLPPMDDIDALIIMGGPMGVGDIEAYPWLQAEQDWIREAIHQRIPVLGVCLGAQLIAAALGARVRRNPVREIGWFPVFKADTAEQTILGSVFPSRMEVFHWHGETFELPAGAMLLASSDACRNQGFVLDERVFALQFHLETTADAAQRLIAHCSDELDGSRWVQSAEDMLGYPDRFTQINRVMDAVLDKLEQAAHRNR